MITKVENWIRQSLDQNSEIENQVKLIIQNIQDNGDSTIDQYSTEFDQLIPKIIPLKPFEEYDLDEELANSIRLAAKRIERFSRFQKQGVETRSFTDEFGQYGQIVSPIDRVGAYIPGGRYPLISSALMTLIPAKVAGCPSRIACSPSDNPAILAAASLAGATQFIQIGGVQAICALTFGYKDIQPVDIVVGPGNAWVNEAKKQLRYKIKIDGIAGPSELLAICDNKQPIDWLALDALAQAEHDPLACSLIVSDSSEWLVSMLSYLEQNEDTIKLLERQQIMLVLAESTNQLIDFSNDFAPEHLMLCHEKIASNSLINFGALFEGKNSAVAIGDYISGPNHTLPTLGFAKQSGGLCVIDFLRFKTVQNLNGQGRKVLCDAALPIASAEGLVNHCKSLKVRAQ